MFGSLYPAFYRKLYQNLFQPLGALVSALWILATGFWNDVGVWDDGATWND